MASSNTKQTLNPNCKNGHTDITFKCRRLKQKFFENFSSVIDRKFCWGKMFLRTVNWEKSKNTSVHLFPAPRSTSKRQSFEVSFKPEEVVTSSNTKQTLNLNCKTSHTDITFKCRRLLLGINFFKKYGRNPEQNFCWEKCLWEKSIGKSRKVLTTTRLYILNTNRTC